MILLSTTNVTALKSEEEKNYTLSTIKASCNSDDWTLVMQNVPWDVANNRYVDPVFKKSFKR